MIKTIIIEDEINVREALKKMLNLIDPEIQIAGESGYVSEAIQLINAIKPDLIFMDIELEDGTGFDVLTQLTHKRSKIIFTTAYNQYAINAFKYSAVDYLLKPIDPFELQEATLRARTLINNDIEHQELLSILKNNLENKNHKIVLKTTEQRYVIFVSDIIHLEADGAYTLFITKNTKIIVSKNLKYYEGLLDSSIFLRCHQSHLVNKTHIKGITKNDELLMSNSDLVSISTRKKSEIVKLIETL